VNGQIQRFADRYEAGRRLAERLLAYTDRSDVMIFGLPRGGIPVAYGHSCGLRSR
jgi:putative phosphoribosyl transferase